jgi:hypothetical protein
MYLRVEFQKSFKWILSYNFFIKKDLSRQVDAFLSAKKTIRITKRDAKTNITRNKGPSY